MNISRIFGTTICLATLLYATAPSVAMHAQPAIRAISADPATANPAASFLQMSVPSHGHGLLGVFYLAAGAAPHPTAVLLHGFPGYEQNLDLAQTLRRAGWNVLALHYRGSWGVGGDFSFGHSAEDADAAVTFVFEPANVAKYRINAAHVIVIGHSMGGYMAASATAHNPAVRALILVSAWDIAGSLAPLPDPAREQAIAGFEQHLDAPNFLPLRGTSPHALATEAFDRRANLNLAALTSAIGRRPVLVVTSDDGFRPANEAFYSHLQQAGNHASVREHLSTDHSYSGERIALQTVILHWLDGLQK